MSVPKKNPAKEPLRLPRLVEADPRAPRLLARLAADRRPLWRGGELDVPAARLTPELAAALRKARGAGHVIRSLEGAETALDAEERGQRMADEESGVPRGVRISRLLLLSADGAERFYRNVETLLARHGQRVLALQLEADAVTLGELLFGSGSMARLVMLEHKDAVAAVLLALAGAGPAPAAPPGEMKP
jgi:hypothetical protein